MEQKRENRMTMVRFNLRERSFSSPLPTAAALLQMRTFTPLLYARSSLMYVVRASGENLGVVNYGVDAFAVRAKAKLTTRLMNSNSTVFKCYSLLRGNRN